MPAYEYRCEDCGREFTVFLTLSEYQGDPRIKCPHCESDHVARQLTGFYVKTSKKS